MKIKNDFQKDFSLLHEVGWDFLLRSRQINCYVASDRAIKHVCTYRWCLKKDFQKSFLARYNRKVLHLNGDIAKGYGGRGLWPREIAARSRIELPEVPSSEIAISNRGRFGGFLGAIGHE